MALCVPARRGPAGVLLEDPGAGACARCTKRGAMAARTHPRMYTVSGTMSLYQMLGPGCCRTSLPGQSTNELLPGWMTARECAAHCDGDSLCDGFEINSYSSHCDVPVQHNCRGSCWLFRSGGGQAITSCDRESGRMLCYTNRPLLGEDQSYRSDITVLLTASIDAQLDLRTIGFDQQRDSVDRMELYRQTVERWAWGSRLPVVFVENSGASLTKVVRGVPRWRLPTFDFISYVERNATDIGQYEARAVVHALRTSRLLRTRGPLDLVLKITGRYFIYDLSAIIRSSCYMSDAARAPWLVVQQVRPAWRSQVPEKLKPYYCEIGDAASRCQRQETQLVGFTSHTQSIFEQVSTDTAGCLECLMTMRVQQMQESPMLTPHFCRLPPLHVPKTKQGSTSVVTTEL